MDLITQVSQLAAAGASAGGEAAEATDDNFQDTVLLLHGDGTDGAGDTSALGDPNYKALRENSTNREVIATGNPYGTDFSPYYYSDGYWSNKFNQSDYIDIASSSDFAFGTGDFTVEFWVYFYKLQSSDLAIFDSRPSNGAYVYIMKQAAGKFVYYVNTATRISSNDTAQSNRWYHLAIVRNSGTTYMYLDGVQQTETYSDSTNYLTTGIRLGANKTTGTEHFPGFLSNVRVVKGRALYTSAFTPSTTPFTDPTTSGELSVYFDGSSDNLETPASSDFTFGTGDFTIEAWARPNGVSGTQVLCDLRYSNNSSTDNISALVMFGATLGCYIGANKTAGTDIPIVANVWQHLCIQRISGTLYFSVNGVMSSTTVSSSENLSNSGSRATIGGNVDQTSVSMYTGYISNLRIVKGSGVYGTSSFTPSTSPFTTTSQSVTASEVSLLACQSKIFSDESTSDHPLIAQGDPRVSEFGPFGEGYWSVLFASAAITTPDHDGFDLGTNDFTIGLFVFPTGALSSRTAIVCQGSGGYVPFIIAHDQLLMSFNGSSWGLTINYSSALVANKWQWLQIDRSGNTFTVYIDGSSVGSTTNSGSVMNAGAGLNFGTRSGQTAFAGYMSNFIMINGSTRGSTSAPTSPLSSTGSETKALLFQSNRFIDNGSVGHTLTISGHQIIGDIIPFEYLQRQIKLITCQGNRFKDIIPERWVHTLVDHPIVSTNTPFTTTKANNVGSVYLSATTDDLEIKVSDLPTGTSARCMEFWVYLPEQNYRGDTEYLVQYGTKASNQVFSAAIVNASGKPRLRFIGYSSDYTTDDDMNENAWNFVSVVYTGSAVYHYLNGRVVHQSTRTLNTGSHTALWVNAEIGGGDTYVADKFYIADLAVYDIQKRSGNFLPPTTTVANTTNTKVLTAQYSGAVRNVGFLDDSNYNHDVTRINDAHMGTFSPFSAEDGYWSCYFDGNHPMEVPDTNSALDLPGDFTVEFWAYETRIATTGGTTNLFFTVNYLDRFQFGNNGSNVFFYNGGLVFSTTPSPLNQWNHYALVREGSGTNNLSCYRNGTRLTQATNTTSYAADSMMIGGQDRGSTTGYHGLYGWISNFRIVKGTALYSGSSYTVPTEPLTAISGTTLLTCQSNRIIDNSTNDAGITTNITSDTRVQPFSPFTPSRSYSKDAVGGSVYNDGSDGLKLTDATRALGTNDLEIEFWYYPTTSSGNKYLIGADFGPILLYVPSGGTDVRLYSDNDGSTPWNVFAYKTLGNIRMSQWNHIYLSRVSSAFYAFINGTASSQNGDAWSTNYTLEKPLYIGTYSDTGLGAATGYTSNLKYNIGSGSTTKSVPTALTTPDSNTYVHLNFTNAGIIDHTMKHNLETEGNTRIRTDVKKFNTGSIYFDGVNGSTLKIPHSPNLNFGTGDFTIEFFIYFTSNPGGYKTIYSQGYNSTGAVLIQSNNNTTALRFFISNSQAFQSDSFSLNTWYHVAWIRSGTDSKLFIDGTQNQSTATNYGHDANNTNNAEIGQATNGWSGSISGGPYPFYGYIDEFRITKGVARYTTDFTSPTQAFANR